MIKKIFTKSALWDSISWDANITFSSYLTFVSLQLWLWSHHDFIINWFNLQRTSFGLWQQADTFLSRLCLNSTHFSKEFLLKFRTDQDRVESWINKKNYDILLSVDFEKAFDSIRWDYVLSSLKAFNFGPNLIGYIKMLYNDISTAIINNGHISTWFQTERWVR